MREQVGTRAVPAGYFLLSSSGCCQLLSLLTEPLLNAAAAYVPCCRRPSALLLRATSPHLLRALFLTHPAAPAG
jgi:hypothetical protein